MALSTGKARLREQRLPLGRPASMMPGPCGHLLFGSLTTLRKREATLGSALQAAEAVAARA